MTTSSDPSHLANQTQPATQNPRALEEFRDGFTPRADQALQDRMKIHGANLEGANLAIEVIASIRVPRKRVLEASNPREGMPGLDSVNRRTQR